MNKKMGRPRKYSKEEAKQKYIENARERLKNLSEKEKKRRKLLAKEWRKKNKTKLAASRSERRKKLLSTAEGRKKDRDSRKAHKKRRLEREPFAYIGEDLKDNARRRGLDAPLTNSQYRDWFYKQDNKCHYCKNDHETINNFINKIGVKKRFKRLQLERIDSSKGYYLNNMVLACYCCNASKSNIISHNDFLEIAEEFIMPKIKKTINIK